MKKLRLPFIALMAAVLLIGASSFYFYHKVLESRKKVDTVRLAEGQPSIYKLPHYLADDKNYYALQNIRVKTVDMQDDRQALSALEKGDADIAMVSPYYLVLHSSSNLKVRPAPVAFAALDRGTVYHLLSRENIPLEDLKSLKGRTVIAGTPNSDETVFLEHLLRNEGLKPYETVNILTNIPADLKTGALKSGTGHYLLVEDKDLAAAIAKGLFKVKSITAEFPAFVCVTSGEFAKSRQGTLQAFTNGLYTAQLWMKKHTAGEAAAAFRNTRGLDKKKLPGMVEAYYGNGHLRESPVIQGKDLELVIDLLDQSKELPMPVNSAEMVNNGFSKAALTAIKAPPPDEDEKTFIQRLKFWE